MNDTYFIINNNAGMQNIPWSDTISDFANANESICKIAYQWLRPPFDDNRQKRTHFLMTSHRWTSGAVFTRKKEEKLLAKKEFDKPIQPNWSIRLIRIFWLINQIASSGKASLSLLLWIRPQHSYQLVNIQYTTNKCRWLGSCHHVVIGA